jgi:hypothetical protein
MGREVRRVPANWQHPKNANGRYIPLFEGSDYAPRLARWDEGNTQWTKGFKKDWIGGGWKPLDGTEASSTYEEWAGERPNAADYMPAWNDAEATHFMMYEDTSEGTPISPAFATPEELARWLVDNNASAFADMTAPYESWLRVAQGGFAPSAVMDDRGLRSGVEL